MPDYRRIRVPGATWFFTVVLADRRSRMLIDHIGAFRAAYRATAASLPMFCDAMVVLPDHVHAVWTLPEHDADFSRRWGAIKARFSMAMRRAGFTPPPASGRANGGVNPALRRKGEIGLWQPRFWEHLIRDDEDYRLHVEYCWSNPVRHGLVAKATDWPFSSIHRDIRAGRVPSEWAGSLKDGSFGE